MTTSLGSSTRWMKMPGRTSGSSFPENVRTTEPNSQRSGGASVTGPNYSRFRCRPEKPEPAEDVSAQEVDGQRRTGPRRVAQVQPQAVGPPHHPIDAREQVEVGRREVAQLHGETGAVVTHVDITARKQAESALTRRATHDPLTGLPNRVLLADRLAHALSRAARTKTQVGLLFCDLDGFRNVNNTFGHLAGDRLLVTIAKRLRAVCRSSDTVARVSGDEFVIILEDVEGRGEVEEVARRIIEALTEPVVLEQGNAKPGTSIGLVISSGVPRAGIRTVENLIRDADSAMYAAKEAGRARYAWFSPEMRERPRERPTFVQAINRLLNR